MQFFGKSVKFVCWSVADPGIPRGGGANSPGGGGRQHTNLSNFPKNCMKLKEFGPPGGGRASPAPPLRSTTAGAPSWRVGAPPMGNPGSAPDLIWKTRMHSSRMCTTCSSSCHRRVSTPPTADAPEQASPSQIPLNFPLAVGLDQIPLNFPLGCGLGPDPPQLPPPLWAWTRSPSISPLGVGLETPLPWRPAARHAGVPPPMHAGIASPPWRPAAIHAGIPPPMHAGIAPPHGQNDRHV